jgi:hypothetical protein
MRQPTALARSLRVTSTLVAVALVALVALQGERGVAAGLRPVGWVSQTQVAEAELTHPPEPAVPEWSSPDTSRTG